jgi:hypothetical protein
MRIRFTCCLFAALAVASAANAADPADKAAHALLITGEDTFIRDASGKTIWSYPASTRDGWVLDNGNILLALSKSDKHPHGAAAEVSRDGKVVWSFEGTQSEVNTVQPLADGRVLLTEAGDKPRILEVDREGKVVVEVPITAQTKDHHLQTRMTRKLANGNYLVPQLTDKVVREYSPDGKIVWEVKTPNWAFTAIRLDNGNTLIGCTVGNVVIEVDPAGKTVWQVSNDDVEGKPFNDCCGVQRLPNGNTVITSYRNGGAKGTARLTEVNPEKKVVWQIREDLKHGIHHFQILDNDGKPLTGRQLR